MSEINYIYKAKVLDVIDGDTVKVQIDLGFNIHHITELRIYRESGDVYFDTPETRLSKTVNEAQKQHGLDAKRRATGLLLGNDIIIKTYKSEKYGRWLAEVWLSDGRLYTDIMISEGFMKRDIY